MTGAFSVYEAIWVKPCQTTSASRFAHCSAALTGGDVRGGPSDVVRLTTDLGPGAVSAPAHPSPAQAPAAATSAPPVATPRHGQDERKEHENTQGDDQHGDHAGLLPHDRVPETRPMRYSATCSAPRSLSAARIFSAASSKDPSGGSGSARANESSPAESIGTTWMCVCGTSSPTIITPMRRGWNACSCALPMVCATVNRRRART